jgi:hypothetical protein
MQKLLVELLANRSRTVEPKCTVTVVVGIIVVVIVTTVKFRRVCQPTWVCTLIHGGMWITNIEMNAHA